MNNTITEGLANNNSKPFWKYIKAQKNDNVGVSPLKSQGKLHSEGKDKAEILINQFSSVFTKQTPTDQQTPDSPVANRIEESLESIKIDPKGVENLLKKKLQPYLSPKVQTIFPTKFITNALKV